MKRTRYTVYTVTGARDDLKRREITTDRVKALATAASWSLAGFQWYIAAERFSPRRGWHSVGAITRHTPKGDAA